MTPVKELRAIACNYVEATKIASRGAKAFVLQENNGGGGDRMEIAVRSRSGRWVKKWEDRRRLGIFRVVTVVKAEGKVFEILLDRWPHDAASTERIAASLVDGPEHRRPAHPVLDAATLQRVRRGPKPPSD